MNDTTTLLSQGPENYMDADQINYFKQQLGILKSQTQESIDLAHNTLHENSINSDPLDSATIEEIKQITMLRVSRDMQLLRDIEEAFDRIHNNEYGFCIETGEPIGIPRLLANPTAKLSTAALSKIEFEEKINGVSNR